MKLIVSMLLMSPWAFGQVSTGTLVGTVTDPSGAALPSTKLTIRHLSTGDSREATANERGEFNAPFLRTRDYSVSATVNGVATPALFTATVQ